MQIRRRPRSAHVQNLGDMQMTNLMSLKCSWLRWCGKYNLGSQLHNRRSHRRVILERRYNRIVHPIWEERAQKGQWLWFYFSLFMPSIWGKQQRPFFSKCVDLLSVESCPSRNTYPIWILNITAPVCLIWLVCYQMHFSWYILTLTADLVSRTLFSWFLFL